MTLTISPCRSLCSWSPVPDGLFACAGCGSQWAATEAWTPRQADGTVPPAVLEARRLSAGSAAAAGSAGS